MSVPEYYEHSLKEPGTMISSTGALISYSGKKTGRSPTDKRIVAVGAFLDEMFGMT